MTQRTDDDIRKIARGVGVIYTLKAAGVGVVDFAKFAAASGVPELAACADDMAHAIEVYESEHDTVMKIAHAIDTAGHQKQAAGGKLDTLRVIGEGMSDAFGKGRKARGMVADADDVGAAAKNLKAQQLGDKPGMANELAHWAGYRAPELATAGAIGGVGALGAGAAGMHQLGAYQQRQQDADSPLSATTRNLGAYLGM